jgi:hypothetical protein
MRFLAIDALEGSLKGVDLVGVAYRGYDYRNVVGEECII